MTKTTTAPTMEPSTISHRNTFGTQLSVSHLDRFFDDALEMLQAGDLLGSVICDGSCSGMASCCIAPVGSTGTSRAA